MADITEKPLSEQLLDAKAEIIELRASTKTTLTGSQFLTIVLVGPIFAPGYHTFGPKYFCQSSFCSGRCYSWINVR